MVWILRIAAAAAIGWLVCVLAVSLLQEKLIFHPQTLSPESAAAMRGIEEVSLKMRDGVQVRGWFLPGQGEKYGAVIYFGGNAEEISYLADAHTHFGGFALALINYRGYGISEGRPGERELFGDALEIYDWVRNRGDVDSDRMVVMGRSLGSGVAVHVAAHRPVKAVILVSPYDAISTMARESYPWVPVNWVLRHPFNSMVKAPGILAPACILFGTEDRIIPPERSRKLAAAWGGKASLREIPGADHNSLDARPEYWESITEFLKNP